MIVSPKSIEAICDAEKILVWKVVGARLKEQRGEKVNSDIITIRQIRYLVRREHSTSRSWYNNKLIEVHKSGQNITPKNIPE